ncbi:thiamine phosphate synthase [Alphaproteobacteria bacterium]|nr:thiamine phosphate synthase [Alphaproteobacteria bacterium]
MKINSICIKSFSLKNVHFWIFLDEDRIQDEITFLKMLPSSNLIGVVVRTKNKKLLYKKAKIISKICSVKRYKVVVSSSPVIAMSIGAYGVHFPKKIKNIRTYKKLLYSCSFHGLSDLRRAKNLKVNKVFISPIFKTTSSRKKKSLGLTRLLFLSRSLKCEIGVLGGVNQKNISKLKSSRITHIAGVSLFF